MLQTIPPQSNKIIEIGCGSGVLAREFKKINADCHYIGLDIVEDYAQMAARFCDATVAANIEKQEDFFLIATKTATAGSSPMHWSIWWIPGLY